MAGRVLGVASLGKAASTTLDRKANTRVADATAKLQALVAAAVEVRAKIRSLVLGSASSADAKMHAAEAAAVAVAAAASLVGAAKDASRLAVENGTSATREARVAAAAHAAALLLYRAAVVEWREADARDYLVAARKSAALLDVADSRARVAAVTARTDRANGVAAIQTAACEVGRCTAELLNAEQLADSRTGAATRANTAAASAPAMIEAAATARDSAVGIAQKDKHAAHAAESTLCAADAIVAENVRAAYAASAAFVQRSLPQLQAVTPAVVSSGEKQRLKKARRLAKKTAADAALAFSSSTTRATLSRESADCAIAEYEAVVAAAADCPKNAATALAAAASASFTLARALAAWQAASCVHRAAVEAHARASEPERTADALATDAATEALAKRATAVAAVALLKLAKADASRAGGGALDAAAYSDHTPAKDALQWAARVVASRAAKKATAHIFEALAGAAKDVALMKVRGKRRGASHLHVLRVTPSSATCFVPRS